MIFQRTPLNWREEIRLTSFLPESFLRGYCSEGQWTQPSEKRFPWLSSVFGLERTLAVFKVYTINIGTFYWRAVFRWQVYVWVRVKDLWPSLNRPCSKRQWYTAHGSPGSPASAAYLKCKMLTKKANFWDSESITQESVEVGVEVLSLTV